MKGYRELYNEDIHNLSLQKTLMGWVCHGTGNERAWSMHLIDIKCLQNLSPKN
jgi:hypothetical protein